MEGVELEIRPGALQAVAKKAVERKTGRAVCVPSSNPCCSIRCTNFPAWKMSQRWLSTRT